MADEREAEVSPQDLHRAFNRQPLGARAAIVAAGPLVNLLLAVVLFAAMNLVGRYETAPILSAPETDSVAYQAGVKSGDQVLRVGRESDDLELIDSLEGLRAWMAAQDTSAVYWEVKSQSGSTTHLLRLEAVETTQGQDDGWHLRGLRGPWSKPVLGDVVPSEPAAQAGLHRGDVVTRVNGERVDDAAQLRTLIRASGAAHDPQPQQWEVLRAGHVLELSVMPARVMDGSAWIGRVGAQIGETPEKVWIQRAFVEAWIHATDQTMSQIKATVSALGRLLTELAAWDQVGGPLMIADYAGRSAQMGLGVYLGYLAMLSVSLGVFNLLPFPVLDGGHLMYYLYELLTQKAPSDFWLIFFQKLGFLLLCALMIFSFLNDLGRLSVAA